MNKVIAAVAIILIGGAAYFFYQNNDTHFPPSSILQNQRNNEEIDSNTPAVTVIAENLDTPWEIVFLPDESMLVSQRNGTLIRIQDGRQSEVVTVQNAYEIGEGGLMGMALHPDFQTNNYIYLYYTYSRNGSNTLNRVVRMTYENNQVHNEEIMVDAIPGASNHNGGRIAFGPDGHLYIATGDAQQPSQAQDTNSLAGKILRVTDDGDPVPGNPFGNRVYSYGHRNPQGLTWDQNGNLWSTEHGRSGVLSGLDELNLIEAGNNYGWPNYEGDETGEGIVSPKFNSGGSNTWAPAGAAFIKGSIYFGGLRGQTLYEAVLNGTTVSEVRNHFKGEFGRIRAVVKGPDNMLYISTSNHDGRGSPDQTDDKIIRINPDKL